MWSGPSDEVLVWAFDLDAIDSEAVTDVLSPDERARAARFHFDLYRLRFVAARAALRYALGAVTGTAADAIEFDYGAHGKPFLKAGGPHFNLSHSDNRAMVAVSRIAPVGIDVERISSKRSSPEVANRFFAPQEIRDLAEFSGDAHASAFFQIWARKEAILKAVGTGIGGGLASFAVPADSMPEPVQISNPNCWIGNLAGAFPYLPTEGFASAVALLGHKPLIRPICDTVLRIPVRRTFK